jgi:hypothetical protein
VKVGWSWLLFADDGDWDGDGELPGTVGEEGAGERWWVTGEAKGNVLG